MDSFYHSIELPGRIIPGNLFLAPIAGFSDAAFRSICIKHGAALGFTEMVSCEGLIRKGNKTIELLQKASNEDFFAVQVFTGEAETAFKAAKYLSALSPDIIDLNCGCPVPKVVKNGAGAALMKEPEKIKDIVYALKEGSLSNNNKKPGISIKIRLGWDSESINYLSVAEKALDAGVELVSLHARTRSQGYSGRANHEHTKILKLNVPVPVLASGDIFSPIDAREIFEKTNCSGLLFSRGSFGNPWIFEQTKDYLLTGNLALNVSNSERKETALQHLLLASFFKGEKRACKEMKKQLCSYTKGSKGAASTRNKIVHASTIEEYKNILDSL